MKVKKKYVHHSIVGINHSKNEDRLLTIEEEGYQLFFVFDGVSSAKNSINAINIANEYISTNHQRYFKKAEYSFIDLMYDVNEKIIKSKFDNALTTYCAIFVSEEDKRTVKISNLGDSRIYQITNQYIEKLTIDDTLYPESNSIYKCLGINNLNKIDFREKTVNAENKRFLLCTDGFYKIMERKKSLVFEALNKIYLKTIKKNLEKIISGKNKDDATYILIV